MDVNSLSPRSPWPLNAAMKANAFFESDLWRLWSRRTRRNHFILVWGFRAPRSALLTRVGEHKDKPRSKWRDHHATASVHHKQKHQHNQTQTLKTRTKLTNKIDFEAQILPDSPIQAAKPDTSLTSRSQAFTPWGWRALPTLLPVPWSANCKTETLGTLGSKVPTGELSIRRLLTFSCKHCSQKLDTNECICTKRWIAVVSCYFGILKNNGRTRRTITQLLKERKRRTIIVRVAQRITAALQVRIKVVNLTRRLGSQSLVDQHFALEVTV